MKKKDGDPLYYHFIRAKYVFGSMLAVGATLMGLSAIDALLFTTPNSQKIAQEAEKLSPPPTSNDLKRATSEVADVSTAQASWAAGTPAPLNDVISKPVSDVEEIRKNQVLYERKVAELTPPWLRDRQLGDFAGVTGGLIIFGIGTAVAAIDSQRRNSDN